MVEHEFLSFSPVLQAYEFERTSPSTTNVWSEIMLFSSIWQGIDECNSDSITAFSTPNKGIPTLNFPNISGSFGRKFISISSLNGEVSEVI